jgi:hypothetical protein
MHPVILQSRFSSLFYSKAVFFLQYLYICLKTSFFDQIFFITPKVEVIAFSNLTSLPTSITSPTLMFYPLTISHSSSQNFEKVDFRPPWPDHRNGLISKSTKARGLIFLAFSTNDILNIFNCKQPPILLYFSKQYLKYAFFSVFDYF